MWCGRGGLQDETDRLWSRRESRLEEEIKKLEKEKEDAIRDEAYELAGEIKKKQVSKWE
ncbi:MAG: UvrB/UvrC motif-containing protein [Pilosibacter sp.]